MQFFGLVPAPFADMQLYILPPVYPIYYYHGIRRYATGTATGTPPTKLPTTDTSESSPFRRYATISPS